MTALDLSPEAVAKMLEGVTLGPWKCCETTIHGRKYGGCWVEGPDVDDGDGMPHGLFIPMTGSGGSMSYTTRLVGTQDHDHNDANARFIAWAREAVPALAARLAEVEAERVKQWNLRRDADGSRDAAFAANDTLRARMVKLTDALEFYADLTSEGPWHLPSEDYGKRARAALKGDDNDR